MWFCFKQKTAYDIKYCLVCSEMCRRDRGLLGAWAPRLAEQYLGQLQLFYGGMAWYLYQDAERAKKMYRRLGLTAAEQAP